MRRIFLGRGGGGGGVPGPTARKQSGQRFFFGPQLVLQFTEGVGVNGFITENTNFSKNPKGVQHFPGGPSFVPRGGGEVQMLIPIETNIICDFPGGGVGPDPLSLLWIHTWNSIM